MHFAHDTTFEFIFDTMEWFTSFIEASVAERLSYPLCKPGALSSIQGFSSLSDETLNRGPVSVWPSLLVRRKKNLTQQQVL